MREAFPVSVANPSYPYLTHDSLAGRDNEQAIPWTTRPELFEGLPDSDCLSILSTARRRDIPRRGVIFQAGDPNKKIFLLTEGRVKVAQVSKDGNETVMWLNVPGQIIGSLDVTEGAVSSAATAMQKCTVLVWDLPAFEANLDRFPLLFGNVMSILAWQTRELSCRVCEISTEGFVSRLAHVLIRLTSQIGRRVNGDFELDITQETLAQMTAVNHFTVNRQVSDWKKEGLLVPRKNTIVIRDLPGLKRLCQQLGPSPSLGGN